MTTRTTSLTDQIEQALADLGYTGETQAGRRRLMKLLAETNPGFHETERMKDRMREMRESRRLAEIRFFELRYQVERVLEGMSHRDGIEALESALKDAWEAGAPG